MAKVNIIYWSGSGNTEQMANLIAKGALGRGHSVNVLNVSNATVVNAQEADVLVLGSPAMGAEVIEEYEMEPYINEIESIVKGKKVALFGSYGWGGGEFMAEWTNRMKGYGANVLGSITVQYAPEGDDAMRCIEFGAKL